ncbi:MAG: hypothetical protein ABIS69_11670, partial [Sediminibacterium sp.]
MVTIHLRPFHHRGEERIGIHYIKDTQLTNFLKKIPAIRWSQTHGCWHIICTRDAYDILYRAVAGKAILDTSSLKIYLQQRV